MGKPLLYAVLPDLNPSGPCGAGCGTMSQVDNSTRTLSHELIEAVTDAEIGLQDPNATSIQRPIAWYCDAPNCGEIGDICNRQAATIGGYTVQTEWSNALGACIATNPNVPPPLCTGTSKPPDCPACTPADCSGATPACASSGPRAGQCVACTSDSTCAAPMVCDPATNACAQCVSDAQCHDPMPVCTAGSCGPCSATAACPAGLVCGAAGSIAGSCVQCASDADCPKPGMTHCDPSLHTCGPTAGPGGSDAGAADAGQTLDGSPAPLDASTADGPASGLGDLTAPGSGGGCAVAGRPGGMDRAALVSIAFAGLVVHRRRGRGRRRRSAFAPGVVR